MLRLRSKSRPMTFSEFIALMNLRFKLFGKSDTIKKFDKYKSKFYNEGTDGQLLVADLSYIETDNGSEED